MMRLRRASLIIALALLASAVAASAQNAYVLWRHFIPVDNPDAQDARLWKAEPETKTEAQCESEVKEYQASDPAKRLHDSAGREYRVEYRCVPDTVDPRGPKGKN